MVISEDREAKTWVLFLALPPGCMILGEAFDLSIDGETGTMEILILAHPATYVQTITLPSLQL